MSSVKIYNFEDLTVRTLTIEDEPFFVGKDVAIALGYKDTSDAMRRHIDDEDKLTRGFTDSGQRRQMTIINESGLYSLILSSKLDSAKRFKRWVTSEVLPQIRKHGVYATENKIDEILNDPDSFIELLQNYKEERKQRLMAEQQVLEMKPKADYYDQILKSKRTITISQIAKDYGMSAQAMNNLLHSLRVQYKQSGQWLLYQNHASKGYTASDTHEYRKRDGSYEFKLLTKWTQKGRLFLYELLKNNDVLPMIERETI